MNKKQAAHIKLPQGEERIWELYHENSKHNSWHTGSYLDHIPPKRLARLHLSLHFQPEWVKKLSSQPNKMTMSFQEALNHPTSCQHLEPKELTFEEVSSLLHAGLGITKQQTQTRGLRSAPSAGNTFPIEGFFYAGHCEHLPKGLYHVNSEKSEVQLLKKGDHEDILEAALMQGHFAKEASIIIFLTGVLNRTTTFFGERGYRLALLETGHIAQNIHLAAAALRLGCVNIGDFYDRKIEEYLQIDGIEHSILDIIVIGKEK